MLTMGPSQPWPDALEAMTGSRQMDATAIVDYFAPLKTWLDEQNKGSRSAGSWLNWLSPSAGSGLEPKDDPEPHGCAINHVMPCSSSTLPMRSP